MKELTATEGNVYALKSDLSIYGKTIILGKEDSTDNWIEIPEPIMEITSDPIITQNVVELF